MAVAIDKLFLKGRPKECVDDLEKICRRCVNRCVATYFQVTDEIDADKFYYYQILNPYSHQTMKWQKIELNPETVLANFRALDLRIGHVIDICESLEQLGRQAKFSMNTNN